MHYPGPLTETKRWVSDYPMITALGYFSFQNSKAFLFAKVITVRASSLTLNVFRPVRSGWVNMSSRFLRGIRLSFIPAGPPHTVPPAKFVWSMRSMQRKQQPDSLSVPVVISGLNIR